MTSSPLSASFSIIDGSLELVWNTTGDIRHNERTFIHQELWKTKEKTHGMEVCSTCAFEARPEREIGER